MKFRLFRHLECCNIVVRVRHFRSWLVDANTGVCTFVQYAADGMLLVVTLDKNGIVGGPERQYYNIPSGGGRAGAAPLSRIFAIME